MKVLLTGGCGLTGRTLAPLLRERGDEVTHFELSDPGDGLAFIQGDLLDSAAVAEACRGKDAIVHLAALHGAQWKKAGDDNAFAVNVDGVKNVFEGAAKAGVRKVVFTSSIWAAGHGNHSHHVPIDEGMPCLPCELYGLTKLLGEVLCTYYSCNAGIMTTALRAGYIRPAEAYGLCETIYLRGGVDVRDLAQAHLLALDLDHRSHHDKYIITADTGLNQETSYEFIADPVGTLEKLVPGTREAVEQGRLDLSPVKEWYSIEKAKRILNYSPQYNFKV